MALLRRIFTRTRADKKAPGEINGVVASQDTPGAMSSATADDQVDQAVKQVSEMTLGDNKYNPNKVAYEFGGAPGVLRTKVGFTGGKKKGPTYYSLGDHTETVEIHFDPKKTSYREMLKLFWENHDPTRCASRQYMSAIFYHGDEQKKLAEASRDDRQKQLTKKIVTRIAPAEDFYNAEDYHQKYLLRQQRDILRELNLTESELITSHAACRLNGFCGGYGTVRAFDEEAPSFKLSPSAQERVRKIVARGSLH